MVPNPIVFEQPIPSARISALLRKASLTFGLAASLGATPLNLTALGALRAAVARRAPSRLAALHIRAAPAAAFRLYRQTEPGERFYHYSWAHHSVHFQDGLRPGSYVTHVQGLTAIEARQGLALPHSEPPDAVYVVTPSPGTWIGVGARIEARFDQPGGMTEYVFPEGTGPGTVSAPESLPEEPPS